MPKINKDKFTITVSKDESSSSPYPPGSSWIQDQEEYNSAKAYNAFVKKFIKTIKKEKK
tara:strand:+ start:1131 stop:1307 length:177 start_codon:yes stop_codon:yes gene_type:complete